MVNGSLIDDMSYFSFFFLSFSVTLIVFLFSSMSIYVQVFAQLRKQFFLFTKTLYIIPLAGIKFFIS